MISKRRFLSLIGLAPAAAVANPVRYEWKEVSLPPVRVGRGLRRMTASEVARFRGFVPLGLADGYCPASLPAFGSFEDYAAGLPSASPLVDSEEHRRALRERFENTFGLERGRKTLG